MSQKEAVKIDPEYLELFAKYGVPETVKAMSAQELAELDGLLPKHILNFMKVYGRCRLRKGLLNLLHPSDLRGVLDQLFDENGELGGLVPFLLTAFGTVSFWHKKHGLGYIDFVHGEIYCDSLSNSAALQAKISKSNPISNPITNSLDEESAKVPFGFDSAQYDLDDAQGDPLFEKALKALGLLGIAQIYAFVPPLSLGGKNALSSLRVMAAPQHFAVLMKVGKFNLVVNDALEADS